MLRCPALAVLLVGLCAAPVARAASSCGTMGVTGEQESVDHDGSLYYVTTPQDYSDATAWPLIIGLHGDEGDPADSVNWFWRDVPDGTFIFVAPKAPNETGSWYEEQESNTTWMDGLLDTLLARYNVDLDRIYMWGLSGGSVFSSRYVMERQDVFAAVEFNMGASGGNAYEAPVPPACKIPARFVVSLTDFLRDNATDLHDTLVENTHETAWTDADCEEHCWDEVQMGTVARDWLLSHTLCGNTPTAGCLGSAGTGGMGTGGNGTAGGDGSGGAAGSGGTTSAAGSAGTPAGGSASGGTPAVAGTSATGGSTGPGTAGNPAAAGAENAASPESDPGCACSEAGRRQETGPGVGLSLAARPRPQSARAKCTA
jgi:hypothetical protein